MDFSSPLEQLSSLMSLSPTPVERNGDCLNGLQDLILELTQYLPSSSIGQEKHVFLALDHVIKLPQLDFFQTGVNSIGNEVRAYRFGLCECQMAQSTLVWTPQGIPIEIQERLAHLTNHAQLPWLPDTLKSYAQVGVNNRGEYVKYDLDSNDPIHFCRAAGIADVGKFLTYWQNLLII